MIMERENNKREILIDPALSPEENLNRVTEHVKQILEQPTVIELDPNNEEHAEFIKEYIAITKAMDNNLKSMTAAMTKDPPRKNPYWCKTPLY